MGAYTISGAVAFNGLPLAKCIYSVSSTHWNVVRQALKEFLENKSLTHLSNETVNKSSNSANSGISMAFPNIYTQKFQPKIWQQKNLKQKHRVQFYLFKKQ